MQGDSVPQSSIRGSVSRRGRSRRWTLAAAALALLAGGPRPLVAAGETLALDTFTLPPGGSVTIELEVTLDNPVAPGTTQVANQGALTGANFTSLLTDDPDVGGAADPTVTLVLVQADLSVVKADSADPVDAGAAFSYTLDVANAGPDIATGVTVTDTLPAGVGFVSASGTGWTCGEAAGVVTCTTPSLAIGAAPQITISVTAPAEGGQITNTASVDSNESDPVPGNDSDSEQTTVTAQADLSIAKSDSADPVDAAAAYSYSLQVANAGPSTATAISVVDTLPAGVGFVSAAGTGWTCGEAVGVVTCTRPSLAVGAAPAITISVTAPDEGGVVTNSATVSAAENDAVPGNDSDSEQTTIAAQADLGITKSDSPDPVGAGGSLLYTLAVTNAGPSTATSVEVVDTLPAGVGFVSAIGTGWVCNEVAGTVTCTRATLVTGAAPAITLTVTAPDEGGTITNTASVSAAENDAVAGNDSDSEDTSVTAVADIAVDKDDGVPSVVPGGSTTYTITVENLGPSSDPSVSVADTFPAALTCGWTSLASGGASGNTNDPGPADISDTLSMPGGSSVVYTVTCDVDSGASGTISNTATATGSVNDPDLLNDTSTDVDQVLPLDYGDAPDSYLTLLGSDGARHVATGTLLLGAVRDIEPEGLASAGADGDDLGGAPPDDEDGVVLPPGGFVACQTQTVEVTASEAGGTLSAWIDWGADGDFADAGDQVLSDEPLLAGANVLDVIAPCDPVPGPTFARFRLATQSGLASFGQADDGEVEDELVQVTAVADLSVTKTDGVTSAVPGQGLVYTIVAANAGPSPVVGASLSDAFPAVLSCGWTSVPAGGATGNTNDAGPANLAETLSLPVGSSVTYTVTCAIASSAVGTLSNTATVAVPAGWQDPDGSDDSATDADTVMTPLVDLTVTKTDGVTSAVPGETLVYTLTVANGGPSDDPAVSFADTFPAALSCGWTSVPAGGATGNTANPGPANLAEALFLPAGSSVTYTVTCDIDPAATGTLSNTAMATASVTETAPADNSATDADTVLAPEADISVTKTDGVTSAVPGESVVYTIVVGSAGPSTDPAVSLTDNFPAALSCGWTSLAAGGATGNTNNAGPADLAETLAMPPGSSVTYTATCAIASGATGTLVNTATATGSVSDPTTPNVATDADTVLTPQADLSITKTDGATQVAPGEVVTYTIVVANAGPSDAVGATVSDAFPAAFGATVTWTCAPTAGSTCTAAGAGNIGDVVTILAGGSATYTATGTVDPGALGTLTNTATVAIAIDPDTSDNSATDTDTLVPEADLAITKVDDADPPPAGQDLTYTITVTNLGPSNATGVVVTDPLPAAVTYVSDTCGASDVPPWTWNAGALAAGASISCDVVVSIDPMPPGSISNTASVDGNETDPAAANDSDTEETTLDAIPPEVTAVTTSPATPGGTLEDCETANVPIAALHLAFSEAMYDPAGDATPGDVTDPASYLLVAPGPDLAFATTGCGGAVGDDVAVPLPAGAVTYDSGTDTATVAIAGALPDSLYRLFACAALRDLAGNPLDGDGDLTGGDDFARRFRVDADNLFANGHFDCDLADWVAVATAGGAVAHDPSLDADGSAESGTADGSVAAPGATPERVGVAQCVELAAGAALEASLRYRLASGPTDVVSVSLACQSFAAPGCAGGSLATVSASQALLGPVPVFQPLTLSATAPAGAASALCSLFFDGPAGVDFEGWIDQARLVVPSAIFSDGFESGDTSAWSATVGN